MTSEKIFRSFLENAILGTDLSVFFRRRDGRRAFSEIAAVAREIGYREGYVLAVHSRKCLSHEEDIGRFSVT